MNANFLNTLLTYNTINFSCEITTCFGTSVQRENIKQIICKLLYTTPCHYQNLQAPEKSENNIQLSG
jgi:hypothetical protein